MVQEPDWYPTDYIGSFYVLFGARLSRPESDSNKVN